MKQITRQNAKELGLDFDELIDDFYKTSYIEYIDSGWFSMRSIVLIGKEFFPNISEDLYGFWETNEYGWREYEGSRFNEINTLTKVEKKTRTVEETYWEEIND
jgi:hypothetical protein